MVEVAIGVEAGQATHYANRYKPCRREVRVLLAGLVCRYLGHDDWVAHPFSLWCVVCLSLMPALNAGLPPSFRWSKATWAFPHGGSGLHRLCQLLVLDFRQRHFGKGRARMLFFGDSVASCGYTVWCRRFARLAPCWRSFAVSVGVHKKPELRQLQSMHAALPSAITRSRLPWHKSECLMCMNCLSSVSARR